MIGIRESHPPTGFRLHHTCEKTHLDPSALGHFFILGWGPFQEVEPLVRQPGGRGTDGLARSERVPPIVAGLFGSIPMGMAYPKDPWDSKYGCTFTTQNPSKCLGGICEYPWNRDRDTHHWGWWNSGFSGPWELGWIGLRVPPWDDQWMMMVRSG